MRNKKLQQEGESLTSLDRVIGEFINEIDELEEQVDNLNFDKEVLERDNEALKDEILELKAENERLQETLDDKEAS